MVYTKCLLKLCTPPHQHLTPCLYRSFLTGWFARKWKDLWWSVPTITRAVHGLAYSKGMRYEVHLAWCRHCYWVFYTNRKNTGLNAGFELSSARMLVVGWRLWYQNTRITNWEPVSIVVWMDNLKVSERILITVIIKFMSRPEYTEQADVHRR